MDITTLDRTESLRAYPSVSAAARMIGVAASTLTRRDDVRPLARGARDQVLPPADVLRVAAIYRKRSLNEVAADLIELGLQHGSDDARRIEEAVEGFFAGHSQKASLDEFLAQARRHLPEKLYAEVEKSVRDGEGRRPAAIVGHTPERRGRSDNDAFQKSASRGKRKAAAKPAEEEVPSPERKLPQVRA